MTRAATARDPRGFFAVGISNPKSSVNVGTLWRTANIFGASLIFSVGRRYHPQAADTMKTPRHVPLIHFADLDDLINHLPESCPLIGVELDPRARMLANFTHPARAAYLLGAEDNGLSEATMSKCHDLIKLPGEHSLNVAVAGSIVIYDRIARLVP